MERVLLIFVYLYKAPLHIAAQAGYVDLVSLLLQRNALASIMDKNQYVYNSLFLIKYSFQLIMLKKQVE